MEENNKLIVTVTTIEICSMILIFSVVEKYSALSQSPAENNYILKDMNSLYICIEEHY